VHDKNGAPLAEGDFVKVETYGKPATTIAKIIRTNPGPDTCNLYVGVPYATLAIREEWQTASKVEKIEL